jgi:WD40 repeat protein
MSATPVYVGDIAGAYIIEGDRHPVALSPDNRYLVVGYDALRVWDLTSLAPAFEERLTIYRHGGPESLITNLRFVDHGVVETTSNDGVQWWDLHTGEFVPR